ncbi:MULTISPECIES: ATP-binding cassette domain-containing protein [Clostridium]|uniref:ATP-binding cassette domain-containing protein n=1 Tax=Clostridium cibarium TaxID=2762247 RepID=A0ABR8PSP3_9CLOT|nr:MULTISPECIES: ATP-binding cassette domain-containing protein [Clostridium]MBD7911196.1 ATP-binding cassette domain-containing protein [Clostridium cibarium]
MIELKNIVKKYNGKNVVDNVSVTIKEGKVTSLIGPNGAGKSTLLSIMSRIISRDSGEVIIDKAKLESWNNKDLAKKISVLKQSNSINMRLTIKEIVSFGRFPYCQGNLTEEDLEHVYNAIEYMKLTDIKDKYMDELSGGQRQRAFIAMIIAQNTDYILLDEPLNNLDMKHSVEIMKILRTLAEELNKTVVIVIHDINFASCYSDYILALKDGKLVKAGRTDEIIRNDVLEEIYDMKFNIQEIENNKICIYFK